MSAKYKQWSDKDKELLAKGVAIAQKHKKPLTGVFDIIGEETGRKSSAVGMFYYNHFRSELDRKSYTFTDEEEMLFLDKLENSSARDYIHWTEEEKEKVKEAVRVASSNNTPLTDVWRELRKTMPHRSESSIAAFYKDGRKTPTPLG